MSLKSVNTTTKFHYRIIEEKLKEMYVPKNRFFCLFIFEKKRFICKEKKKKKSSSIFLGPYLKENFWGN